MKEVKDIELGMEKKVQARNIIKVNERSKRH